MKRTIYIVLTAMAVLLGSCAKELQNPASDNNAGDINTKGLYHVRAKAILGSDTKISYVDEDPGDVVASWEVNDTIIAFVDSSIVYFVTDEAGKEATFDADIDFEPTAKTEWLGVYAPHRKYLSDTTFLCTYDGQDGTLENIKNYAFMRRWGTSGEFPVFNFSKSRCFTYVIKLELPAGVQAIEVNNALSWKMSKSERSISSVANVDSLSLYTLPSESTAGQFFYLAIPAIDYSKTGLIVTILGGLQDGEYTKSRGKVFAQNVHYENYKQKGGYITNLSMKDLEMFDRPTSKETTKLDLNYRGRTSDVTWAQFNVGGSRPDKNLWTNLKKNCKKFKFGMTVPVVADDTTYFCNTFGDDDDPLYVWNGKYNTGSIAGSRWDAARVHWGSGWRMPTEIELRALLAGSNPIRFTDDNGYTGGGYKQYLSEIEHVRGYGFTDGADTLFFPTYNQEEFGTYASSSLTSEETYFVMFFQSAPTTGTAHKKIWTYDAPDTNDDLRDAASQIRAVYESEKDNTIKNR